MHWLSGNDPSDRDRGRRYAALLTVRGWLRGRSHLPRDLVAALHLLIPDLDQEGRDQHGSAEDD